MDGGAFEWETNQMFLADDMPEDRRHMIGLMIWLVLFGIFLFVTIIREL